MNWLLGRTNRNDTELAQICFHDGGGAQPGFANSRRAGAPRSSANDLLNFLEPWLHEVAGSLQPWPVAGRAVAVRCSGAWDGTGGYRSRRRRLHAYRTRPIHRTIVAS